MLTLESKHGTSPSKFLLFIWSCLWSQSPILATPISLQIKLNETDLEVTDRIPIGQSFTSTISQDPNKVKSPLDIHPLWFQNTNSSFNGSNTIINCLQGIEEGAVCEQMDIFKIDDIMSITEFEDIICLHNSNNSHNPFFLNITKWVFPDYEDAVSIDLFRFTTLGISIIGSLANSITVMVIVKISKLHKPFYFSMLCLALSDMYFHVLFYILNHIRELPLCTYIMASRILEIFNYSAKFSTSINVILMLTVRYIMFVYPLRSMVWLTNRKIFLVAGGGLVLSIGYGLLLEYSERNISTNFLFYFYVADDISLLVFFFVINVLFLVQRIKAANESVVASHLKTRMIVTVIFVLSLNTMNSVLRAIVMGDVDTGTQLEEDEILNKISSLFQIATFGRLWNHIVHSINPFLYFFSSPLVLRMCSKTFLCKK